MNRRRLLGVVGSLAVGGGCLRAPGGVGGGDGDGNGTGDPPRIVDRSLRDTGRCETPESASVAVDPDHVRVEGCVTGPNGCAVASLGSATLDGGTLSVVVTTESNRPPDTACTEALVYRGYVATVRLSGGEPDGVEVIHDAPGERRTVAAWP
jgi:hypothetical protein